MFDLTGKSALVTGASGGIGGAIAVALHRQGATVALSGMRVEALRGLATQLGERTHTIACNLADAAATEKLVGEAEAAMSKALAAEVASRGITVNCLAPGFIATPMTDALNPQQKERLLGAIPAGRLGASPDVAAAVVFLASDEAAYVTGQTLHVNGGMAMI